MTADRTGGVIGLRTVVSTAVTVTGVVKTIPDVTAEMAGIGTWIGDQVAGMTDHTADGHEVRTEVMNGDAKNGTEKYLLFMSFF